jgi:DNA-binding response OmpR family regulator
MQNSDLKSKAHILIVEDDAHIAEGLQLSLGLNGYSVTVATDGADGLAKWKQVSPDLIVLDIMLPVIDGLTLLQSIRLEDSRLPILILSAKAAPEDVIRGLHFGVDDYLTKPFNLEEFLLRVERLLTRANWANDTNTSSDDADNHLRFGNNRVNFSTQTAWHGDQKIELTDQETKLLKLFAANPNKVMARSVLLEVGWGYTRTVSSRTIDNFMVRLRRYFEENPKKPVHFKSVRAKGYRFDPGK